MDEIGISAGATATEIKSVIGRAQATALRKNKSFLTYGFNQLLEMMLYHQEQLFDESFIFVSGFKEPKMPEVASPEALDKYQAQMVRFENKVNQAKQVALSENKVPPGVHRSTS